MKKKLSSILLSIVVAFIMTFEPVLCISVNAEVNNASVSSINHISDSQIDSTVNNIVKWYKNGNAKLMNNDFLQYVGSTAGDWLPIGAARYGVKDDYDAYLNAISQYITNCYATDEKLSDYKATEWERIILAVSAVGGDPTHIGKDTNGNPVNLIADGTYNSIVNYDDQGINAYIFGLLALDSKKYTVPAGAKYTRDDIIKGILSFQLKNGGFSWGSDGGSDDPADPDMSAMAVQALAPYYNDTKTYTYNLGGITTTKTVKQVINESLQSIEGYQADDGDMKSWGSCNAESTDQVIVALCSIGIDPEKDSRFITKTGKTLVNGLMKYVQADGGIAHSLDTGSNGMSTDQTLYALAAIKRQRNGMTSLYDYTDEIPAAVPVIKAQPQNVTLDEGKSLRLAVTASLSDNGVLSYQWYKNNTAIIGATSSEYCLQNSVQKDAGNYYVVVTDTLNGTTAKVTSNTITVTINKTQPQPVPQPQPSDYVTAKDDSTGISSVEIQSKAISDNTEIKVSVSTTPIIVNIPTSDFSSINNLNKIKLQEKQVSVDSKIPDDMNMLYLPFDLELTCVSDSGSLSKVTSFKAPVKISLKMDKDKLAGIDTSTIKLYYLNNGVWSEVSNAEFDEVLCTITATTPHFSVFSIMAKKSTAQNSGNQGNAQNTGNKSNENNSNIQNNSNQSNRQNAGNQVSENQNNTRSRASQNSAQNNADSNTSALNYSDKILYADSGENSNPSLANTGEEQKNVQNDGNSNNNHNDIKKGTKQNNKKKYIKNTKVNHSNKNVGAASQMNNIILAIVCSGIVVCGILILVKKSKKFK